MHEHGTVARDSLKELLLQARPPPPGRRRADAAERGRSYWRGDCTRALFLTTPNSRDPKASPARSRSRAARLPPSPPLPRPDSPKGRPGRPRVPAPRFPVGLIPPGVPLGCSSLVLIKPEWPRASGLSSWRQRRGEEGKKGKAGGSPHRPPRAPRGARAGAPRLSVPTRPATPQRLSELRFCSARRKHSLSQTALPWTSHPRVRPDRAGGPELTDPSLPPALRAQRAAPRRLSACKPARLLLPPPNR